MAFDSARSVVVLCGGNIDGPIPHADDTWEWDGVTWTEVVVPSPPLLRTQAAMAYDGVREEVVLHGGTYKEDDSWFHRDDTWTYGPIR